MGEGAVHPGVAAVWRWEGRVQHAIAEFLRADGWMNIVEADTARRAHGTDIHAERRPATLLAVRPAVRSSTLQFLLGALGQPQDAPPQGRRLRATMNAPQRRLTRG